MASVYPARNVATHILTFDRQWTVSGGAVAPLASYYLSLVYNGATAAAATRIAMKFDEALPGWLGDADAVLNLQTVVAMLFCQQDCPDMQLEFVIPANVLTTAMTAADLDNEWSGGAALAVYPATKAGWMPVDLAGLTAQNYADILEHGLLIGPRDGGTLPAQKSEARFGSFSFGTTARWQGAKLRRHFYYSFPTAAETAPTRAALSAEMSAALLDPAGADLRLTTAGVVEASELDPAAADVVLGIPAGAGLQWQAFVDPLDPYEMKIADCGSISAPIPAVWSNPTDSMIRQGAPFTVTVSGRHKALSETLATMRAVVGECDFSGAAVDLSLANTLKREATRAVRRLMEIDEIPTATDVAFNDEHSPNILWHLLLNAMSATRWSATHPQTWYWLGVRHPWRRQLSATIVNAYNDLAEAISDAALAFGAFIGQTPAGLRVWHPAMYDPHRKQIDIANVEAVFQKPQLRYVDAEGFGSLRLEYTDTSVNFDTEMTFADAIDSSRRGEVKTLSFPDDSYDILRRKVIRESLLRQHSQRYSAPVVEFEGVTGKRALEWELGDQLWLTWSRRSLTAQPFIITGLSGSPSGNAVAVKAHHYMGWPGGHSRFAAACNAWFPGTYLNKAWSAGAIEDFALVAGTPEAANLATSWEGGSWGLAIGANTDCYRNTEMLPSDSYYDLLNIVMGMYAGYAGGIGEQQYNADGTSIVWRWWDAATEEGIVCYCLDPLWPAASDARVLELWIAHVTDADPRVADGVTGAGNVLSRVQISRGGSNNLLEGTIKNIALVWDPSGVVKIYENQAYVGALANAPAKSIIDRFDVCTGSQNAGICCIRWRQSATEPAEKERQPLDGYDIYQP